MNAVTPLEIYENQKLSLINTMLIYCGANELSLVY